MKKLVFMICMLFSLKLLAQKEKIKITDSYYDNNKVEMADGIRSSGKIYVVVGVIFIIFAGISFYLFMIERKVTALEKEIGMLNK